MEKGRGGEGASVFCIYSAVPARVIYTHASGDARTTIDLLQKSEDTLKSSAFICVYLSDICGLCINRRLMQEV